jgi:hypothetical protein
MKTLFQRAPEAQLSSAAETLNLRDSNLLLDELFKSRAVLAERSYRQLASLFTNKEHYGRNVRLGVSAEQASKLLKKAVESR